MTRKIDLHAAPQTTGCGYPAPFAEPCLADIDLHAPKSRAGYTHRDGTPYPAKPQAAQKP
jgi:hypothetical protein